MRTRISTTLAPLVAAALLAAALGMVPSSSSGADEVTPGLTEARQEAERLAGDLDAAESRLAELEDEIAGLERQQEAARAQLAALQDDLNALALHQYVQGAARPMVDVDVDRQARAEALAGIVNQADTDTLDEVRALRATLDRAGADLAERHQEQAAVVDELEAQRAALAAQLAELERLEAERLEAERQRAEREAREAREAAQRASAQARADELARLQAARTAGAAVAAAPAAPAAPAPTPATPAAPVVSAPAGGGMVCPVPGAVFRDSWGEPRSGGRSHRGVDMMASTGAPIVAPVSGTVQHGYDGLGGNNFTMTGDNGWHLYGAHLSAYGQSGTVAAGTVIGYVGETGNAQGAHLHFEIHIGGTPVNPYPYVASAC